MWQRVSKRCCRHKFVLPFKGMGRRRTRQARRLSFWRLSNSSLMAISLGLALHLSFTVTNHTNLAAQRPAHQPSRAYPKSLQAAALQPGPDDVPVSRHRNNLHMLLQ
jgi:hypothetical protein